LNKLNIRIVGKSITQNINKGLTANLLFELLGIVIKMLSKIDKENNSKDILFLIKLSGNLKNQEPLIISYVKNLPDILNEIFKLITNCTIQFFCELNSIETPDLKNNRKPENICELMRDILNL